VNFHDILAAANPNPFLRFSCELINEMIRQLIVFGNRTPQTEHRRFGEANARSSTATSCRPPARVTPSGCAC
jgi:DNA-binding FadR family transcriptional regulator